MQKYQDMARNLGMANAVALEPGRLFLDPRAILKCRWGCEDYFSQSIKCSTRGTSLDQRQEMLARYQDILLLHAHDARPLSKAVLAIERAAFLDGNYFAFGVRYCMLCKKCAVDQGQPCPQPEKVRPCDQAFGIDVYKTAASVGLPIQVLGDKDETQNRYGFVFIS